MPRTKAFRSELQQVKSAFREPGLLIVIRCRDKIRGLCRAKAKRLALSRELKDRHSKDHKHLSAV